MLQNVRFEIKMQFRKSIAQNLLLNFFKSFYYNYYELSSSLLIYADEGRLPGRAPILLAHKHKRS